MKPFPTNAAAVEWEFRCNGKGPPGHSWEWRCRVRDGAIVAKSLVAFKSLRDAISDAVGNGFQYETRHSDMSRDGGEQVRSLQ